MAEANSEQGQKALHERYGFDSADAMAAAFDKLKADHADLKGKSRDSKELAEKLAALEAAEAKRKESEMTETDRLKKQIADHEKALGERDALLKRKDREILTERVFSAKLSGKPAEEAAILRRLLSSAVAGAEFADEAELGELLKPVETEYEALRAKFGTGAGPAITPTGGPRTTPASAGAFKDWMSLPMADKIRAAAAARKG